MVKMRRGILKNKKTGKFVSGSALGGLSFTRHKCDALIFEGEAAERLYKNAVHLKNNLVLVFIEEKANENLCVT